MVFKAPVDKSPSLAYTSAIKNDVLSFFQKASHNQEHHFTVDASDGVRIYHSDHVFNKK